MDTHVTHAVQDYLKVIFDLTADGQRATTNQIAERLAITAASVSGMIYKMAADGLLDYQKRQGVRLTADGRTAALEVIRHHRLIETFLYEVLGYRWDEVHEEACRLEHVISEKMARRMAALLGNPLRDPHGDPIPTVDLEMPPRSSMPLTSLQTGQTAVIQRIKTADAELLQYIDSLGLKPQTEIRVLHNSAVDELVQLEVSGRDAAVAIGGVISRLIFIKTSPDK